TFGGGRIQLEEAADVYSRTHWEWESDRLEGATAAGDATIAPVAGSLHVDGGSHPTVVALPEIDLADGTGRVVELRAERSGGEGRAFLLVRRGDEPIADGERFELDLPATGTFAELEVDIGSGPVRGLGILPFDTESGVVDIDFVRVVAGAAADDPGEEGCDCASSGRPVQAPLGLLLALSMAVVRRSRRAASERL
ncbi:MAG: hypothetical protein JNK04_01860, partial [Myxococcales bacterium]|nr:hypothetical protein [Myxococcales bacterium]